MIGSLQRKEIKNMKGAIFEIYSKEFSKNNKGCQTTDL